MYNNERVIIDTRKYDIDEMLFRYKQGKIIFYEKKCATWKRREKVVQDIIKALLRGIPFPPVYASELQTGELLILDKSDKLRFLLEYLAYGDVLNDDKNVDYDRYWERTILYSTAMLYVIDYMNPRYMHMQVGKFVEEWTAMQEQSVWNVLYHGDDINILKYMIKEARHYRLTKLNLQYYLMHYLMVDFVVCGKIDRLSKKITKQGTDSEGKTEKKIKLIYCSSDRIGVKDTYEKYLGDEIVIGKNCDYVFHYLNAYDEMELDKDRDFVYDSESKLTFGGQVNFWLNKIMGYQVKAREIEKTEFIQVLYRNEKVLFEMRPKNVGTGVTYITELIIAALACKEGDLLIIENPEIHLHPSGQSELVEFLAFLAQCGVQIIVETHSDHIYNGIRKSIRLDQIDSDKVNIYSFTQDIKGCSIPIKIPVNGDGKALNNAEGFFDQIDKDLNVILEW